MTESTPLSTSVFWKTNRHHNTGTSTRPKMVYVSGGQVLESRSPWRFSAIPDFFWGIINFIVLFFKTMVNPDLNSKGSRHTSDYRPPGSGPGGPPGPPRRRYGGFRGGNGAPSPPPMGGGG